MSSPQNENNVKSEINVESSAFAIFVQNLSELLLLSNADELLRKNAALKPISNHCLESKVADNHSDIFTVWATERHSNGTFEEHYTVDRILILIYKL